MEAKAKKLIAAVAMAIPATTVIFYILVSPAELVYRVSMFVGTLLMFSILMWGIYKGPDPDPNAVDFNDYLH